MADALATHCITDNIQIEVFGEDLDGFQFIERVRTLTITRDGATIPLANKLAPECELVVRNTATSQEALARVVDLTNDAIFVQIYGVAFIDPSVNLWQADFPEPNSNDPVVMECGRCHAVEAFVLTEIELEILKLKQSLARRCGHCAIMTTWMRTERRVAERRATDGRPNARLQDSAPVLEPRPASGQDRRKARRNAMKVSACIRIFNKNEVVECENVSRGGFRFKSSKAYPAGTPIEVAVPYKKSNIDIFVPAQIAYQQEIAGGLYRHGAAYVIAIQKHDSKC